MNYTHLLKLWLHINLVCLMPTFLLAQSSNIGSPPITNFYKKTHQAGTQDWGITQDKRGVLYFANNKGLLEFDGSHWRCYPVTNKTIVRSLTIAADGKIFVGAQNELGYFESNRSGNLEYHSLKYLLDDQDKSLADIWTIEIVEDKVFFRTGSNIFLYQNESLKEVYRGASLSYLTKINQEIFIHDFGKGILKLKDSTFQFIANKPILPNVSISGIFPFQGDTLLISTLKGKFYLYVNQQLQPWEINDNNVLQTSSIYCSTLIDDSTFAFGTASKGIFIVNLKGQVLQHIDNKSGLQVNNVLSLFLDRSKNLWAGLDNGISLIEISSPFTYIFPDQDLKATGYAIQILNGKIYFGTTNALYQNNWATYYNPTQKLPYKKVPNADGQIWNISTYQSDLFIHHHEGIFTIKNNKAFKIPSKAGSWLQIPVGENKLLAGDYTGLSLLEKENTGWKVTQEFQNDWQESCRIMEQDAKGNIWVSHPYRGVFKVKFEDDFSTFVSAQPYNSKDGFPSDFQIYLFKIGSEVVFCAEKGIYSYNESTDRFEVNPKWTAIFGKNTRVNRLIEASNGNIWFVTDKNVGVLEVTDNGIYKTIETRFFPELKHQLTEAFEEIYPYDDHNVFFAHETGFIHFNPKGNPIDTVFNTLIRSVQTIYNDNLLYGGSVSMKEHTIDYANNALHFTFSAAYFKDNEQTVFQHYLESFDKKWSTWTTQTEVEYTNLNSGDYTFKVRAKNINGHFSPIAMYHFTISPPWYASKLALSIYIILIIGFIFSLIFIPQKQFQREKAALQSEQEKTLLQQEQEYLQVKQEQQQQISKLEKDKLELEIRSKNQELASSTMHIVQKGEMLQKIKEDIQKIAKEVIDPTTKHALRKVAKKISADEQLDNDWQQFAKHFDQVHSQFIQRLRSQYPQLTPKDHRLCAYLRMNLSSKEMAQLLNISVRSVEVARYRLRKKLEIDSEVNLVDFMMGV